MDGEHNIGQCLGSSAYKRKENKDTVRLWYGSLFGKEGKEKKDKRSTHPAFLSRYLLRCLLG